jgi:hypothetical protein
LPEITLEDNKKFLIAKSELVLDNPTELFKDIVIDFDKIVNSGNPLLAIENADISTFQ